MKNRPKLRAVLTIAVTLGTTLFVFGAYQFISLRSQNTATQVAPADCLVVLGASVWANEQPSNVLRDRIARAADLYHEGVAKKIIVTGGVGRFPPAEAEVERRGLVAAGVPHDAIIMETESTSTADQARMIKTIADREGFHSIALVTSFYHEKRAMHLFRQAGLTQIEDARCRHTQFVDLNYWVARESVALSVVFWWQWAMPGLVVGVLLLLVQRRRS
ncbi:MAG: YdcF family protein [Pyrinomonadaceae bacterium]